MKIVILTSVMVFSLSGVLLAQESKPVPPPPAQSFTAVQPGEPSADQMAQAQAKAVKKQYKLTQDQYVKIVKIETDFFNQERAIRNSGKPPVRGTMMKLETEKDKKYKEVMTPKQYAKYSASRPQLPPPPPPQRVPASENQPAH